MSQSMEAGIHEPNLRVSDDVLALQIKQAAEGVFSHSANLLKDARDIDLESTLAEQVTFGSTEDAITAAEAKANYALNVLAENGISRGELVALEGAHKTTEVVELSHYRARKSSEQKPSMRRRLAYGVGVAATAAGVILAAAGNLGSGIANALEGNNDDQASENARKKNLAFAERAKRVPVAVKRMESDDSNIKENIHAIFNEEERDWLDHDKASMSSLRSQFKGNVSALDFAETVAYSARGSTAFAAKFYNELHGDHKSKELPSGVTDAEARHYIEQQLTADGAKFSKEGLHGTFLNHGQRGERVFDSGIVKYNGQEAFVVTGADGQKVAFKISKMGQGSDICVNFLDKVNVSHPQRGGGGAGGNGVSQHGGGGTGGRRHVNNNGGGGTGEDQHKKKKPPRRHHGQGDPGNASQEPHTETATPTPGYGGRGHAEHVVGQQQGDPTNLNPTQYGTEAPNGAPAGGVVSSPGSGAQDNPEHTGNSTSGTTAGTGSPTQTEGSGQTSGAGSDPGQP